MMRDMNLSQTSGALRCILITLCEGKHDYEFISEVFKRISSHIQVKEQSPSDKDLIIRRAYDSKLPYVTVIVEGGKDVLDGNVRILISKLRSIPRSFIRILILRDSDSNYVDDVFKDLRSMIEREIERKFSRDRRLEFSCGQKVTIDSFVLYDCTVRYVTGYEVYISFILVVNDLETFLSKYGFSIDDALSLNEAIEKALNDPVNGSGAVEIFKRALGPCITQ